MNQMNDKLINDKKLMLDWDYQRNLINPANILDTYRKSVYWVCHICGHRSKVSPRSRKVSGCHACNGDENAQYINDVSIQRPDLVLDWSNDNEYMPDECMMGSKMQINWVCHVCGHKWHTRLDSRTLNGCGCPVCGKSVIGNSVSDYLLYFLLKVSLPFDDVFYRYKIDNKEVDVCILFKKICIEYDGYGFHSSYESSEKDRIKEEFYLDKGFKFFRIKEREDRCKLFNIYENIAFVPMSRQDNFEFIKESYVKILSKWGIIDSLKVPNVYYSVKREYLKSIIQKPVYEKSLAYFFNKSNYSKLAWDYNKNKVTPEDIYARTGDKYYFRCPKGHSVEMRVSSITRGNYGCPYCSNQRK